MNRRNFITKSGLVSIGFLGLHQSFGGIVLSSAEDYHIEQFKDSALAQYSYAVKVGKKIVLIDPARDPQPYYTYAEINGADIIAVIETHPHADFVSSHLEIHKTLGVPIYTSALVQATYPHIPFDDGDFIQMSDQVSLKAWNTPGHSADSISILLEHAGKNITVFSGDSLLFGDVGRPDLRAFEDNLQSTKLSLAKQMYSTVTQGFATLADAVLLYPAHGAGSLCANEIRDVNVSTIGYEKKHNHAFRQDSETEFVQFIIQDQPFVPLYFPYNVELNKKGAENHADSVNEVPLLGRNFQEATKGLIIDTRNPLLHKKSRLDHAINIPDGNKFETWIGTIVAPKSPFYLVTDDSDKQASLIKKIAKIGYEKWVLGVIISEQVFDNSFEQVHLDSNNQDEFTIIDVRTVKEAKENAIFSNTLIIPLSELNERFKEIPQDKPILIHCASGYRSAIGSSLLKLQFPNQVILDLGANINLYVKDKSTIIECIN